MEVVKAIQHLNKVHLFRWVDVQQTPRHLLPPNLKKVPTVMGNGQVLEGKTAIFGVLSKPVESRHEVPQGRPAELAEPTQWSFEGLLHSSYLSTEQEKNPDQLRYSYVDGLQSSGMSSLNPDGSVRSDATIDDDFKRMGSMRNEYK